MLALTPTVITTDDNVVNSNPVYIFEGGGKYINSGLLLYSKKEQSLIIHLITRSLLFITSLDVRL